MNLPMRFARECRFSTAALPRDGTLTPGDHRCACRQARVARDQGQRGAHAGGASLPATRWSCSSAWTAASFTISSLTFGDALAQNSEKLQDRVSDLVGKSFSRFAIEVFENEQMRPVYLAAARLG